MPAGDEDLARHGSLGGVALAAAALLDFSIELAQVEQEMPSWSLPVKPTSSGVLTPSAERRAALRDGPSELRGSSQPAVIAHIDQMMVPQPVRCATARLSGDAAVPGGPKESLCCAVCSLASGDADVLVAVSGSGLHCQEHA